jgi:glutaminase
MESEATLAHDGTRIERISTGALPSDSEVRTVVTDGYERYRSLGEGTVATYIPALAQAPSTAFGVCVAGVRGGLFAIGDADVEFSEYLQDFRVCIDL